MSFLSKKPSMTKSKTDKIGEISAASLLLLEYPLSTLSAKTLLCCGQWHGHGVNAYTIRDVIQAYIAKGFVNFKTVYSINFNFTPNSHLLLHHFHHHTARQRWT
ncbi:hypothetical protein XU18_2199 [Perkinsela sp. CCAP 1560/4]|nr:hypothetical protein XU18_2199 [Perkinsela sp. CCAP 1560/4]|eukprot:KNH07082.1 hypothetical protein XU18_2199 [Perkinsela sp. CCAP 1560/4]